MYFLMIISLTSIVFCIFKIMSYYSQQKHFYEKAKRFPGPKPLPFVGNAYLFVGKTDILDTAGQILNEYSSPFRVWFDNELFIVISDPSNIKTILMSPKILGRYKSLNILDPLLGTGLFTVPVSSWKLHRKLMTSTLNISMVESFVDIFAQKSLIMIREMESKTGELLNMSNILTLCTLDIAYEAFVGVSTNVQTSNHIYYVKAMNRATEILISRVFNPLQRSDLIFNFTSTKKELDQYLKYLNDFRGEMIRKKQEKHHDDISTEFINENDLCKKKSFLDAVLDFQKNRTDFDETEVEGELKAMLFAASNIGTISSFLAFMLANYQDIQEKVYQELNEIYGPTDPEIVPVKYKDLNRMEYLERVIKETIRLFPAAPAPVRYASEDVELGEWIIPKGAYIAISIYHLHRNEKYWPNALNFDPDRFSPENNAKRDPKNYIPFGVGPRSCTGMRYSMMKLKTIISTMLRRYKLTVDSFLHVKDIKLTVDVAVKPTEPIKIRVERRNNM